MQKALRLPPGMGPRAEEQTAAPANPRGLGFERPTTQRPPLGIQAAQKPCLSFWLLPQVTGRCANRTAELKQSAEQERKQK